MTPSSLARSAREEVCVGLCGSVAILLTLSSAMNKFYKDPFRVTIMPPLLGVVIDSNLTKV
jgi:hypothetical protein